MAKRLQRIKMPEQQDQLIRLSGRSAQLVLLDGRTLLLQRLNIAGKTLSGLNGRLQKATVLITDLDEVLVDE